MKSIVFNEQQLKAHNSGAKMFLVPILEDSQNGIVIDEIIENMISYSTYIEDSETSWDNAYIENFIKEYAPLQKGDEFIIQERIDCIGDCNIGLPCQACGSNGQGIGELNIDLFKDVALDVEVKRVQDLFDNVKDEEYEEFIQKFGIQIHGGGQIADSGDYGDTWYTFGEPKESNDGMHIENCCNEGQEHILLTDYALYENSWNENPYVFLYTIKGK